MFAGDSTGVDHPSGTPETRFVAVNACRLADTRVSKKPLTAGAIRGFYVAGTTGFAPQGGKSGGCAVPVGASAVALSVTSTRTSGTGFLSGWATGVSPSTSNFASTTRTANVTSNPTLPIAGASAAQLQIRAGGSTTDVIIDVTGYYMPAIHGLIYTGSSAYTYSGSLRVKSIHYVSTGVIDVTVDRDITYCTMLAGPYYPGNYIATAQPLGSNVIRMRTTTSDANATAVPTFVWLSVTC